MASLASAVRGWGIGRGHHCSLGASAVSHSFSLPSNKFIAGLPPSLCLWVCLASLCFSLWASVPIRTLSLPLSVSSLSVSLSCSHSVCLHVCVCVCATGCLRCSTPSPVSALSPPSLSTSPHLLRLLPPPPSETCVPHWEGLEFQHRELHK